MCEHRRVRATVSCQAPVVGQHGHINWLLVGSEPADQRAAAIMSLLVTAEADGQDPHAWLSDLLHRLPTTRNRDIEKLLPPNWNASG